MAESPLPSAEQMKRETDVILSLLDERDRRGKGNETYKTELERKAAELMPDKSPGQVVRDAIVDLMYGVSGHFPPVPFERLCSQDYTTFDIVTDVGIRLDRMCQWQQEARSPHRPRGR